MNIAGSGVSSEIWFANSTRNVSDTVTVNLSAPSNLDFALFKNFPVTERVKGQFRVQTYNLTNTPHFNNPGGTFGSATFGVVTSTVSAADSRTVQLGAKLSF